VTRGRPNPKHYTLPLRLRQARQALDLTAVRLSLDAGLSRTAVFSIEKQGRAPGIDVVELLARVLRVSPGWLAFDVEGQPIGSDELVSTGAGSRLRAMRESRGLTLREVAEAAGITHTTVRATESGRTLPSVATTEQLADALEVSPAWLAYEEGPVVIQRRRARKR
jgi:transcriptional regulator with XRE-family HTH domain